MKVKKPSWRSDSDYVQLYATTKEGYNVVKNKAGEYICSCDSLLDECDHIAEFKKEESAGNIE